MYGFPSFGCSSHAPLISLLASDNTYIHTNTLHCYNVRTTGVLLIGGCDATNVCTGCSRSTDRPAVRSRHDINIVQHHNDMRTTLIYMWFSICKQQSASTGRVQVGMEDIHERNGFEMSIESNGEYKDLSKRIFTPQTILLLGNWKCVWSGN